MAASYQVVAQSEVLELGPSGLPERMVQVSFKTVPSGVEGTVRIPQKDFSASAVQTLLEAAAAEREAVAGL